MSDEPKSEEPDYSEQLVCLAPQTGDLLIDYLIGELEPVDSARFSEHMILCFKCQDMYAGFQAVFQSIRNKRPGQGSKKPSDRLAVAVNSGS